MEPAAEPVLPAFEGASVMGIVPALVGGRDRSWIPEPARDATAVVVLVLDGLGWNAVQQHRGDMPTIAAMTGGPITTVVPSTTSTALTSICTGLAPAQHGILGYRMLVGGSVLNVLRWSTSAKTPPEPFDVQRHPAFLGREIAAVTKSEFRNTSFTHAHLRGAKFVGWSTTAVMIEHVARLVASGDRFVYAYYPGVDTVAHEFGLHEEFYDRELAFADRLVGDMLDALPARAALLVTSDHGQVHLERADWVDLDPVASLVDVMAGDGRFRYLYARKGAAKELLDAARELVGAHAWVRSRAELLADGWIGSGATGSIPGRIGDVVLASRDASAFVDPALPVEVRLRSGHGSLTPDEMWVPLLAALGSA
ncbi:MAG: alkaline phosphatase family protein [Actinomycetota bacterium]